jgi:predicted O-linked N-acetylglucosamine transferase (SPINDLY family)
VIQVISNKKVDIAIDLGGYTQDSRFGIFVNRVAPVQMSYLGFLGTTGSDCIDYIIADEEIIPKQSQKFYTEKIAYLPSYQVNDSRRTISNREFTKSELGIPENAFVYCCFNNNFKILPETFISWMRILKNVSSSVLFLFVGNEYAQNNLQQEAIKYGVDPSRLIFGGRLPPAEYLARYKVADLFLDTFPYNAGTTASDSLWAGVPVLTRQGETFSSRVASSLLKAIGLPELITTTIEDYEALACELGNNPALLGEMKAKLRIHRGTMPLFDTIGFARNIERLYIAAHDQFNSGRKCENIYIT